MSRRYELVLQESASGEPEQRSQQYHMTLGFASIHAKGCKNAIGKDMIVWIA